jgi:NADH-quinone oxidoreductase subunit L
VPATVPREQVLPRRPLRERDRQGRRPPDRQAAYWVNQHVLDGIVNGAGKGGRKAGDAVYKYLDQGLIDGVGVNGSGKAARGTGGALRPLQSGKVNQYGALLFGAAAIGALVLVIVNI